MRRVFIALILACCAAFLVAARAHARSTEARMVKMSPRWEYALSKGMPLSMVKDTQGRPYLYVADKDGGLQILDVSRPTVPQSAAAVMRKALGGLDAMAVTQDGQTLYLALGDFFDVHGSKLGLAVVDVSAPDAPKVLAVWLSRQTLQGASAVLAEGNTVFLSAMQTGVLTFDVTDKKNPRLLSTLKPFVDFPHKNPGILAQPKARGMALHENTLLLADDAGGLRVIDVSDKAHPKEKAAYINASLMHKQQAYNAVALDWPLAYVTTDYCGLEVVDLSDLQNIKQKGMWNPWDCGSLLNYWINSPGHANQIVIDPARKRLYLSAGDSELRVLDISNPSAPKLVAGYGAIKDGQGAWGLALGKLSVYLSYIKAQIPFGGTWSGIRAFTR